MRISIEERLMRADDTIHDWPYNEEPDPATQLVTDVMHYCDREEIDFYRLVERARGSFEHNIEQEKNNG